MTDLEKAYALLRERYEEFNTIKGKRELRHGMADRSEEWIDGWIEGVGFAIDEINELVEDERQGV
jgi:hypothetical protein